MSFKKCTPCPGTIPYYDGTKCTSCPENTLWDVNINDC